ncbi:WD40 repeat domain-containing protein [Myxococcota bacterium]
MKQRWKRWLLVGLGCMGACAAPLAPAAAEPQGQVGRLSRGTARRKDSALAPIGAANVARVRKLWEVAAGGRGRAVAVSRTLRQVAFASDPPARLYDLRSGREVARVAACADIIRGGLAFVRGKLLVVCSNGVQLFKGTQLSTQKVPVHSSRITAAHAVGNWLALGHYDGFIRIYSLADQPTIEIPVPGPPIDVKSVALTRDGLRVAVAWIQGSIWWWNTAEPGAPHPLVRHTHESDAIAFSPDGNLLAEEGEPRFTTLWDFANQVASPTPAAKPTDTTPPLKKARLRNGAWVKRILFTHDSRWLVRGGSDGLELAELGGPRRVALDTRGDVEDVGIDENGARLAAVDRDGRLTLWGAR